MFGKASSLFTKIQTQTSYSSDHNSSSMLIDTAYASKTSGSDESSAEKPKSEHGSASSENPAQELLHSSSEPPKSVVNIDETANFTKSEIDLLKELSKRREKLDQDGKDLDVKGQVLKATETKLDQKISEMKSMQAKLEDLMKQYNAQEQKKITSLVKIYETMKPKDAAKIFNELEMPILIKVVSNMKEVKVAPIIATMTPLKARDLSVELARNKGL
jgi:flagellar motility protein MotE (MotC chaperone)